MSQFPADDDIEIQVGAVIGYLAEIEKG